MSDIIKADIFFFITSIAVALLSILTAIVLYHLIRIFQKTNLIIDEIQTEIHQAREDIAGFRASMRANKNMIKHIFKNMTPKVVRKTKTKKNDDQET
ncbi:MAG: hypothetical protein O2794_02420 [bacterium]|nr:hypothetical protein [bacterium]